MRIIMAPFVLILLAGCGDIVQGSTVKAVSLEQDAFAMTCDWTAENHAMLEGNIDYAVTQFCGGEYVILMRQAFNGKVEAEFKCRADNHEGYTSVLQPKRFCRNLAKGRSRAN